jgi:hypothetical protein
VPEVPVGAAGIAGATTTTGASRSVAAAPAARPSDRIAAPSAVRISRALCQRRVLSNASATSTVLASTGGAPGWLTHRFA